MTRPATFPASLRAALAGAVEISIHTATTPPAGIVIWVVLVGEDAYVRSYRGRRGKWHAGALADPAVSITVDRETHPARVEEVTDPATIAAVSAAFLAKYAGSPYAAAMVAEATLATTLRLSA
jgi:hypothetical protein